MKKLLPIGIVVVLLVFLVWRTYDAQAPTEISPTISPTLSPTPIKSIIPYNSGIKGRVLMGPTCPVMRDPPDPGCADRPYKTTVLVYQSAVPENIVFAKTDTDADGKFTISLPPGAYRVEAEGGNVLPRCSPWVGSVGPNEIKNITISCDTGIR